MHRSWNLTRITGSLSRLALRTQFAAPDGRPLLKGVIVDTETTGLDQATDKIMEIGLVVFEFDPVTGQAFRILETYNCLEDPDIPIPPEATEFTGITNERVAGKRIDDAKVGALVKDVQLWTLPTMPGSTDIAAVGGDIPNGRSGRGPEIDRC